MSDPGKSKDDLLSATCAESGLVLKTIQVHEKRVRSAIDGGSRAFQIETPCRIENGGIVSFKDCSHAIAEFESNSPAPGELRAVAFVPAAGAASRFLEPLKPLAQGIQSGDMTTVKKWIIESGLATRSWPLPERLKGFLGSVLAGKPDINPSEVLGILSWPKAFFPCNKSGTTFLGAKVREHQAYSRAGSSICGEVYVTPAGQVAAFTERLEAEKRAAGQGIPHCILEQDGALSTLRFRGDGSWARTSSGKPSTVPAGHGALTSLFPRVRQVFPAGDFLLIRNVDNVCGTTDEVCTEVAQFHAFAAAVIRAVRIIRAAFSRGNFDSRDFQAAVGFLAQIGFGAKAYPASDVAGVLAGIQRNLFHSIRGASGDRDSTVNLERLKDLFSRPVNILGQVPNSGKDVGGTPVFTRTPDGRDEKLCIEVAHVSTGQVDSVLANPRVATHFNPVFVASELVGGPDPYAVDHPYWSCVRKKFEGEDVFYHESFLYEILGSSSLSNVVFIEIPRILFNPHKTLSDAQVSQAVL